MKNYKLPVGVGYYVYFFEKKREDSDIKYVIKCERVHEIEINQWGTHFKTTYFTDLTLCNYDNFFEPGAYWTNSRKKAQEAADWLNNKGKSK